MLLHSFTIKQKNSLKFFTFELFYNNKQIGDFYKNKYDIKKNVYSVNLDSAHFDISQDGISKAHTAITPFNNLIMPFEKEKIFILKKEYLMKPTGIGNLAMEVWDSDEKIKVAMYILKGMLKKEDIIEIYEKMTDEELNLIIGILFYRHQYYLPLH